MGLPDDEPTAKTDDVALGELLVELIHTASSYTFRGEAFANSEQWDRAEKDFMKAIELGDQHFSAWYERALVRRAMGDAPGYQAACAEILKQFPFAEDTDTAHFVAWTCALGPDALPEFALAVASAERAAKKDAKSAQYASGLGAILFRAGRFDEARQKLEEADRLSSSADPIRSAPAYNWFFLAMTHHRLGNADEAKQWFDKARDATDKALNELDAGTVKLPWNRRLTLNLLRGEAETLLGIKSTPAETAAVIPANDEAPVEAKKPKDDSIDN
jgi:tetratricopeptide (TPR) repeat protein